MKALSKHIDSINFLLFTLTILSLFLPFRVYGWQQETACGFTFLNPYLVLILLVIIHIFSFSEQRNKWLALGLTPIILFFLIKTRYEVHHDQWILPPDTDGSTFSSYGVFVFISLATLQTLTVLYKIHQTNLNFNKHILTSIICLVIFTASFSYSRYFLETNFQYMGAAYYKEKILEEDLNNGIIFLVIRHFIAAFTLFYFFISTFLIATKESGKRSKWIILVFFIIICYFAYSLRNINFNTTFNFEATQTLVALALKSSAFYFAYYIARRTTKFSTPTDPLP